MGNVIGVFLEHGVLGVVALLAIWFAIRKDREVASVVAEKDALHGAHAAAIAELNLTHKAEMEALQERYITKAETWMSKYHEMTDSQNDVLISLERRWGK